MEAWLYFWFWTSPVCKPTWEFVLSWAIGGANLPSCTALPHGIDSEAGPDTAARLGTLSVGLGSTGNGTSVSWIPGDVHWGLVVPNVGSTFGCGGCMCLGTVGLRAITLYFGQIKKGPLVSWTFGDVHWGLVAPIVPFPWNGSGTARVYIGPCLHGEGTSCVLDPWSCTIGPGCAHCWLGAWMQWLVVPWKWESDPSCPGPLGMYIGAWLRPLLTYNLQLVVTCALEWQWNSAYIHCSLSAWERDPLCPGPLVMYIGAW